MTRHTASLVLTALMTATLGADRAVAANSPAASDEEIAKTIIAIEKAALDRWGNGDVDGFLEIIADDYTYFDPSLDQRITGYERIRQYYDRVRGKISTDRYELIDPKVQVAGDTAILTFNLKSYSQGPYGAEKQKNHWHATEVYRRIDDGQWKLLSTHWSFTGSRLRELVEAAAQQNRSGEGSGQP